jgi:type 1 fimbriae regulatory protein FimB/type 1 fimbriae regulatory protein FimE
LAVEKPRKRPLSVPEDVKYLSEAQIAALFRRITDVRDTALFRVIYHRGLRASEPALIELSDWDGAAGVLTFRRKKGSRGGKYRLVDVEARAVRAWVKKRGTAAGPLFVSRNHRALGERQVHRLMRRYAIAAGIPAELAHPHSLKHSCGTHVLARVKDLVKVKDHLGHRSIQSTEIYAQVLGKTREEVADQLRDWR